MVFSSPIFLFAFLPAVFLLHACLPTVRTRNILLAAASVVFYAFGQLNYVPLFLASVLVNYLAGRLLMGPFPRSRAVLTAAVLLNLGALCFYKYTDFVLLTLGLPPLGVTLPIGISFYTFQGLSYVIDTYRRPEDGTRDFGKLLLYLAFFPQLIAGPIVKYGDISAQIDTRVCSPERTEGGIFRFVKGLAKKLLVADALGVIVDAVFDGGAGDVRLAWLAAVCYTLQIYYDFSGYSDMALGLGAMFGFSLPENFRHPYAASSIRDFWRRWHISLSSWFKEYLYIPLGGNREGRARTALNRLVVFLCTGLWHGANWTFVLWGLGHGLLSSLEDACGLNRLEKSRAGRLLLRIWALIWVILLFALFRAESLTAAGRLFAVMFSGSVTAAGTLALRRLVTSVRLLTLLLALPLSVIERPVKLSLRAQRALALLLFGLSVLSLAGGGYHPFLYFQF